MCLTCGVSMYPPTNPPPLSFSERLRRGLDRAEMLGQPIDPERFYLAVHPETFNAIMREYPMVEVRLRNGRARFQGFDMREDDRLRPGELVLRFEVRC